MPLEWKYVSPTGDPQRGDGGVARPGGRSSELRGSDGVCLSSCPVQNESATANAGGLMLFQESQVVNSRLRGGRYGVIQLRNTTVANCVLRDHAVAALWNPVVPSTGAVQGWTIHVTADRIGDFWKAHAPEPPPDFVEPLTGLYMFNCHVTNASGFLLNFKDWHVDPEVLTGATVRNVRVRQVSTALDTIMRNVDDTTTILNTLFTDGFDNPDDGIDYVDASSADYRLVPNATGRGKAPMSGWDLGAHLNQALFL